MSLEPNDHRALIVGEAFVRCAAQRLHASCVTVMLVYLMSHGLTCSSRRGDSGDLGVIGVTMYHR